MLLLLLRRLPENGAKIQKCRHVAPALRSLAGGRLLAAADVLALTVLIEVANVLT